MSNAYVDMRERQQAEVNAFPMKFAFNKEQFEQGMRDLGLDPSQTDQVIALKGTGGFMLKTDVPAFREMMERHGAELEQNIDADPTGDNFVYDMFRYELANHEFGYTGDPTDAIEATGISPEEVEEDPKLLHGLEKAMQAELRAYDEMMYGDELATDEKPKEFEPLEDVIKEAQERAIEKNAERLGEKYEQNPPDVER